MIMLVRVTLRKCLLSSYKQTVKPKEIILVCDGELTEELNEEIERLKKEIPKEYNTFEELLEYTHKLDFKLNGTYNEEKEIKLTSNENEV